MASCSDQETRTYPRIRDSYAGKTIFITGGSGFLGKVIIEKLLWSCPDLERIYMLIRPKRNKSILERKDDIFKLELFKNVIEKDPRLADKVVPVFGDILQKNLGIGEMDLETLRNEVDIVIHSAATVRFDEHLRIALQMNVVGALEVMNLCKSMQHLKLLCHVSTAYSNVDKSDDVIQEKIYPISTHPRKVLELTEWMTDDMLTALTPQLIAPYPNTYCYTKNMAEYLLTENELGFPLVIYRPSIISVIKDDPITGWIDNYNGPAGIIAAIGKGLLRTIRYKNPKATNRNATLTDIVPVDYVSNGLLAATWDNLNIRPRTPVVYNCTSGNVNPLEWDLLRLRGLDTLRQFPFENFFRRPNFDFSSNAAMYSYWTYVSHRIPAFIADTLSVLTGVKPQVGKIYNRIDKAVESLQFFIENGFKWDGTNFHALQKKLSKEDSKEFNFDMSDIDWNQYITTVILGVKEFLLKDNIADLPKAKRQVQRHRLVRFLSCTLLSLLSWRILITKSILFRQYWQSVAAYLVRIMQFCQSIYS